MSILPRPIYSDNIKKKGFIKFYGLSHTNGAGEGAIYDMMNLAADDFPLISVRRRRRYSTVLKGQIITDFYSDGEHLYTLVLENGQYALYVDSSRKDVFGEYSADRVHSIATIGTRTVIAPEMMIYDSADGSFYAAASKTPEIECVFRDGTYAGEDAKACTIEYQGDDTEFDFSEYFKVGDGITIEGATDQANNKTLVLREISATTLGFYEYSFLIPEEEEETTDGEGDGDNTTDSGDDTTGTGKTDDGDTDTGDTEGDTTEDTTEEKKPPAESEIQTLTLSRAVPKIDFICENENRLWGCRGSQIYSSKVGDPTNWNVFDGVASDSYAVQVGSKGDFTACCSYLGYPIFFKEDNIYKVYGSYPSQFQVLASASLGVKKGSHKSLAVAGEILFFLSRVGIMAYSGGIPQHVSSCFGNNVLTGGVAGSNGRKYFVSLKSSEGDKYTYVYDTEYKLWHKEDSLEIVGSGYAGGLFFAIPDGTIYADGSNEAQIEWLLLKEEEAFDSFVEFADFTDENPNRKGVSKIQLRLDLEEGASVKAKIKLDGEREGEWKDISTISTTNKRSYYLPIIPKRADHYKIRLEGKGEWRLHSLTVERYSGSERF
ncbi:MAG: hypothetical protein IJC32_00930 [Clostridia bacterium]|nr:hypothetical protein [Clostridia bacterium]